jgi:hypothetical protein
MPNILAGFYYRSFCDLVQSGVSFSGSTDYVSGSLINVNDRDLTTFATTSGKNNDATSVDFKIDLGAAKTIDTIALWSNFKTFTVYYSTNGTSWTQFSTHASNAVVFTLDAISVPVSARYIKITATATNPANSEKKIYEAVVTAKISDLPISTLDNLGQSFVRVNTQNLRGGNIQIVMFPQSPKFHVQLNFKYLTTLYAAYDAVKNALLLDSCLVYLYYSDLVTPLGYDALYLVNDISDKNFPLSSETVAAGIDGSMELMEV